MDIQFRNAVTGLVLVPKDQYDDIATALAEYKFVSSNAMRPINLHLRAYPEGGDGMFYLHNLK